MNKLGFGFLRLPRAVPDDETSVDFRLLNDMVDSFIEKGGRYFDTAYTYLGGASELAIREAVVKRHPREKLIIADKLPSWKVACHEDLDQYFNEQLERCGVDYFDNYLLHWLNRENYAICERWNEFEYLAELKAAGRIRHMGFSYHDSAELLDTILTEHPYVDYVQLQINYLDWDSDSIQSGKCYEAAARHSKRIVVMEPVKGGTLAKLPPEAEAVLRAANPDASMASWALRFVQSLAQVETVLSGMNSMEQIIDNLQSAAPLSEAELDALAKARRIIQTKTAIPCTGCGYCAPHCPANIPIPRYFGLYNEHCRDAGDDWKIQPVYNALALTHGRAADCLSCGQCEENCPQKLPISTWMKRVSDAFDA